jgi:hypothetical protein
VGREKDDDEEKMELEARFFVSYYYCTVVYLIVG